MHTLDSLRRLAGGLGRGGFAARFPNGFLLREPSAQPTAPMGPLDEEDSESFGFSTDVIQREALGLDVIDEGDGLDLTGWIVVAVAKSRGNPFPDRISVGRARNCDVVLRYPSISKLHGHFKLQDGRVEHLLDYQSANGTYVNGVRVPAGAGAAVKHGDKIRFGNLELEFVSAVQVYTVLTRPDVPTPQSAPG